MSSRYLASQLLSSLWNVPGLAAGAPSNLLRLLSTTQALRMPDVVVPPMGESIKEGTIAAVLKQVCVSGDTGGHDVCAPIVGRVPVRALRLLWQLRGS